MGERGGQGTTMMIVGGEVALLSSSSSGAGKNSGERVAGGRCQRQWWEGKLRHCHRHSCCHQLWGRSAHVGVGRESCGRHAQAFGGAEEKESNVLVLEGDGPNNQHKFVSRARKKKQLNSSILS